MKGYKRILDVTPGDTLDCGLMYIRSLYEIAPHRAAGRGL